MINLAMIGLGGWGKQHIRCIQGSDPQRLSDGRVMDTVEAPSARVRYVRAVDLDTSLGDELAAEHDIPVTSDIADALADPDVDALVLTTPNTLHAEQVIAAARAGKHIYCEKPLTLTKADARAMVQACADAGVQLALGHNNRFQLQMEEVKRLVETGALGTITHVEGNTSHALLWQLAPPNWRALYAESPTGGLIHMGIHHLDHYADFFGPIEAVHVLAARRMEGMNSEYADTNSMLIKFANGMTGTQTALMRTPRNFRMQIFGAEGWAEARGEFDLTVCLGEGEPETTTYPWTNSVRRALEAFADAIDGIRPFPISTDHMIRNTAMIEAMTRSLESGKMETVE